MTRAASALLTITLAAFPVRLDAAQTKIVVLPLKAQRIDPAVRQILDGLVVTAIATASRANVVGSDELAVALELEGLKDRLGCSDVTCAAEIGGALDARYTVSGSLGRLGDSVILQLRLFDGQAMRVVSRAHVGAEDDENAFEAAVHEAVAQLFSSADFASSESSLPLEAANGGDDTGATVGASARGTATAGGLGAKVQAQRDEHQLSVNSLPAEAHVFLDGDYLGQTPFSGSVAAGTYELAVEMKGHQAFEAPVEFWAGDTSEHMVRLQELETIRAERRSKLFWGWSTLVASTGCLVGSVMLYRNFIDTTRDGAEQGVGSIVGKILGATGLLTLSIVGYSIGGVVLTSAPSAPVEPHHLPALERDEATATRTKSDDGFFVALEVGM